MSNQKSLTGTFLLPKQRDIWFRCQTDIEAHNNVLYYRTICKEIQQQVLSKGREAKIILALPYPPVLISPLCRQWHYLLRCLELERSSTLGARRKMLDAQISLFKQVRFVNEPYLPGAQPNVFFMTLEQVEATHINSEKLTVIYIPERN